MSGFTANCTYNFHCIIHTVKQKLYNPHCLATVHYTLETSHSTMLTVHFTLYTEYCRLHTGNWIMYIDCTLHSAQPVQVWPIFDKALSSQGPQWTPLKIPLGITPVRNCRNKAFPPQKKFNILKFLSGAVLQKVYLFSHWMSEGCHHEPNKASIWALPKRA